MYAAVFHPPPHSHRTPWPGAWRGFPEATHQRQSSIVFKFVVEYPDANKLKEGNQDWFTSTYALIIKSTLGYIVSGWKNTLISSPLLEE
ncbi:hypothetical protein BS78_02G253500 [Paspalum vaginatum]|nr:hypothetical protein BS78_02G253500 [Paspalum vaginatum]